MTDFDDFDDNDALAELAEESDSPVPGDALSEVLAFTPTSEAIAVADAMTVALTQLEPGTDIAVVEDAPTAIEPRKKTVEELETEQEIIEHESDFKFVRESMKQALQRADQVLLTTQAIAQSSDDPKAIDAFSKVLKEFSAAAETLMRLHQGKQEFKAIVAPPVEPEPEAPATGPNTTIAANTIVFTGTTSDLLNMVNTKRR